MIHPQIVPFPRPLKAAGPREVKRPKRREAPPFLSFEEVRAFFKVPMPARDRAIFRLAYHAGLRASEIGMLDTRDYNPRTRRIYIHRLKGSHSGEHYLMHEEERCLRAWLRERGPEPGAVFPSRKRMPISRYQLDRLMKRYGRKAGIPAELCHMHIWKHTCCTHMRSMGRGVEDIQDWVGHANIQNSMIYSHLTNARREEVAKNLSDTWR